MICMCRSDMLEFASHYYSLRRENQCVFLVFHFFSSIISRSLIRHPCLGLLLTLACSLCVCLPFLGVRKAHVMDAYEIFRIILHKWNCCRWGNTLVHQRHHHRGSGSKQMPLSCSELKDEHTSFYVAQIFGNSRMDFHPVYNIPGERGMSSSACADCA